MTKVYISIPAAFVHDKYVRKKCEFVKEILEKRGYIPVSMLDASPNIEASYSEYIGNGIKALIECDAVCFLSGWETDKSCRLEHAAAQIYGKEIWTGKKNLRLLCNFEE